MKAKGYFYISQLKQLQGRFFEKLLQENGITDFNEAQGKILAVLWQEDGLSMADISKRTGLAKTTLTSMLERLVRQELLIRRQDPEDKRISRMMVTDKAKGLKEAYEAALDQLEDVMYQGLTEKQKAHLEKRLKKILRNLQKRS